MKRAESGAPAGLARTLKQMRPDRPVQIMEVCGTHTVAIRRHGIQQLLADGVRLQSGPGCPVCVTPDTFIDEALALAAQGFTVATFGDMVRVPGSLSSLQQEKSRSAARVRVVYSPLDALQIAAATPGQVVFLAVGFETTVPAIAVTAQQALERKLENFFLLCGHRLIPPALRLLSEQQGRIDGFLLPGHVSAIIGRQAYLFLEERGIPAVISGFEPAEIISSLILLLEQIGQKTARVLNNYGRVVADEGNPKSRAIMAEVFRVCDASWRGLGPIPASGLELAPAYEVLDARRHLPKKIAPTPPPSGCRCGDVLAGRLTPPECPLFKTACHPDRPLGPCMVSSEGSCSAWFLYG